MPTKNIGPMFIDGHWMVHSSKSHPVVLTQGSTSRVIVQHSRTLAYRSLPGRNRAVKLVMQSLYIIINVHTILMVVFGRWPGHGPVCIEKSRRLSLTAAKMCAAMLTSVDKRRMCPRHRLVYSAIAF